VSEDKTKECKICGKEFVPFRAYTKCCSHQCAIKLAVSHKLEDERRGDKK